MQKKFLSSLSMIATTGMLFALPPHIGTTNFKASSINNFDFNLSWEDVQLEPTNSNDIVVEIYCNNKKFAPKVKTSSDTLVIESVAVHSSIFSSTKKLCTVIVKVPDEKEFENFKIHTSSGDIKNSLVFSADEIIIEASSGDIKVENQISSTKEAVIKTSSGNSYVESIQTKKLTAEASSGNVSIDKAVAKTGNIKTSSGDIRLNDGAIQSLTMTASSGDITCNNVSAGDSVIQTTSGNIKLKGLDTTDLKSSASSGNITAQDLACSSFDVSTTSGTIGLEIIEVPASKSSVSSSSGTQFISLPQGARINLHVSTSSGSFTNAFTKEKIRDHVSYDKSLNGGGVDLTMSSSSASITLDVGKGIASDNALLSDSDDSDIPVVIFKDEK